MTKSKKLICVPIQEKSQKKVIQILKKLKGKVDLAEIWLDHIEDLDIPSLLKNKPLPVLCVCKKPVDKGKFKGGYEKMAEILIESAKCGADYIDIPLDMPEKLSKKIIFGSRSEPGASLTAKKMKNTKSKMGIRNQKSEIRNVIFSYHDFKKTPSMKKMLEIAESMKKSGADIVKIAVMAKILENTFSVILLAQQLQEKKIPHILIAMGEKGILSRVLTPFLGGTIMFAPLSPKNASASGQLTVKELREAWGMIKE